MHLIRPMIQLGILTALSATIDPTLRQERELQRRLRDLEDREAAAEGMLGRDLTGEGYIKLNFFNLFWVFMVCCVLGLIIEVIFHMVWVDPGVYQDRAGLLFGPFSPIYGFGAVLLTVALNRFYKRGFVLIFLVSALMGVYQDRAGLLFGPFSPIYGFGAVLLTVALNRFYKRGFVLIFLVSALIGGVFEAAVGWWMQTSFGAIAWAYSYTVALNRFYKRGFVLIFLVSALIGGVFEAAVGWWMQTSFGAIAWAYSYELLPGIPDPMAILFAGRTSTPFMLMWGTLGLFWIKVCLPRLLKLINLIPWKMRYSTAARHPRPHGDSVRRAHVHPVHAHVGHPRSVLDQGLPAAPAQAHQPDPVEDALLADHRGRRPHAGERRHDAPGARLLVLPCERHSAQLPGRGVLRRALQ